MLSKPVLALTTDRGKVAQTNDYCGNPEDWFDSRYFRNRGLYSASFDFFVNWENETICDEVWIKRISDSDNIQRQTETQLLELIANCDGRDKSNQLYRFLTYHQMIEKYMLFRDVPERAWENGEERVVELDMSRYRNGAVSTYDVGEIQDKIRELRRRPASIGNAGLRYSTSSLEGYLSKRPFFWPGDADAVLYNENNDVVAVIEFKKHTANSRIPFQDQGITNYLEKDILKYKSLALLRDRFNSKLYVLYYPIPQDIHYVIVEEIEGNPDQLHAVERYKLDLPNRRSDEQMDAFAEEFITRVLQRRDNE